MTKAMIISVGGTEQPIIKSIHHHKPEFVSFLASQKTVGTISKVKEESKTLSYESQITIIDLENDLTHCYEKSNEAIKRVVNKGYAKENVIVDYTGGTKNMTAALTLASISHGFSYSYVGGEKRTKNGVGIVEDGHEKTYESINPWDFLAVTEKKKLIDFFNTYQFKATKAIINSLMDKNIKNKYLFKKIGFIIEGYSEWDLFRHSSALEKFKRAKIEEIMEAQDEIFVRFAKDTNTLLDFLKQSKECNDKPCRFYMLDLFSNAQRRQEEEKVDDAILRLYRIVEMIAQERLLEKHGIDTSNVKKDQIPESLRSYYEEKSNHNEKIKISFNDAYILLNARGDELGKTFIDNQAAFKNVQQSRNNSYLAHGFTPSKNETYKKLEEFILKLNVFKDEDAPVFPKITE